MTRSEPEFPKPIRMNGRLYWRRSEIEKYKHSLISQATGTATQNESNRDAIESFVTAEQVAKEFGFGRRTLGRRIAATPDKSAAA